jgi:cobalt-zinc-cadmium efflux system outer membrane protein
MRLFPFLILLLVIPQPYLAAAEKYAMAAEAYPSTLNTSGVMDLRQVLNYATEHSLQAQALLRRRAIAEAEVLIAQQRNNPVLIGEESRSEPNHFIGAGYLFELGGKRQKRIDLAKFGVSVAEMNYRADLLLLRHDVRIAFYELLQSRQKSSELESLKDLASKLHEISRERFETGAVAKFDELQAELELKRTENDLKQSVAEEKAFELKLRSLLSLPGNVPVKTQGSLEDIRPVVVQDLIAEAIAKHPQLQALIFELKSEEARLALAKVGRVPDLDVEAGSEIHDAAFQYGWRAAVRIGLPIFNQSKGEITRSNAALESLKAEEALLKQRISADIQQAYLKFDAALKKAENFRKEILPLDQEIQELSLESYHEGKTGILPAIDAQRNTRRVRLDYLQVLFELQTALADLEQAAGVDLQ